MPSSVTQNMLENTAEQSTQVASSTHQSPESTASKMEKSSPTSSSSDLSRPPLGSRKSSGTIIISRDSPTVEVKAETYDADDARAMSPRRGSEEIQKMGDDARKLMEEQAASLQAGLAEIIERIDSVKQEHEKLEGGNQFLQSYIGELMQTSKLTSTGGTKSKSKGRSTK